MNPKIENSLNANKTVYREIKHNSFALPIKSPFDFAKALDYEIERITKSVFLRSKAKDKYVMAVCSCNKKLNLPQLALLAQVNKLEVADQQELSSLVNYPIYGVSSIGLSPDIQVFMDDSLLNFTTVLAGSGETAVEIELSPKDLSTLSNATLATISL